MDILTLKPGAIYQFRIVKTVLLSDHEHYIVLESPALSRHLLDKELYPAFRFKKGELIQCRIDKINCSGKIFLEPENPDYTEGNNYDFLYSHKEDITNTLGGIQSIAVLKGRNGEKAILPQDNEDVLLKPDGIVNARLIRIKKGVLILHKKNDLSDRYQFDKTYSFQVIREGMNHKKNPVFILSDSFGNEFSIQKDNYRYYGIRIGEELQCKITGCNLDGRFTLEPRHPYLEEGKAYAFRWLRMEPFHKYSGEVHEIHIVADDKENEHVAAPIDNVLLQAFKTPVGLYRIERIHKGKLVLIPQP